MKLPIPIFHNGNIYKEIELQAPTGAVIADVKKVIQSGDVFTGIKTLISGCTVSIGEIVEKNQIKSLIAKMPYRTAEAVAIKIVTIIYPDDDGIEGIYPCPRCGEKIIAELKEEDGMKIDTRDFISQLQWGYIETDVNLIPLELSEPVTFKNGATGEILFEVSSLEMGYPTIENAISAYKRIGLNDEVRMQYVMFAEALITVNGELIDQKWKNAFGLTLFESMKNALNNIGKISSEIRKYGIDPTIEKRCPKCEKVWRPSINTTNFFVSALQLS